MQLETHRGYLFAGIGYWTNPVHRNNRVIRLECARCEWKNDGRPSLWAGRIECLKSVKWRTPEGGTLQLLHASWYMDFLGVGHVDVATRDDADLFGRSPRKRLKTNWNAKSWVEGVAYKQYPYKNSWMTGRSMHLYTDPITKEQHLILPVGRDGIVSGQYDPKSPNLLTFSPQIEPGSGPLPTRPLALAEMDGHLYCAAGRLLLKRTKGSRNASWTVVFDMWQVDQVKVDEAVGGLRGLTTIDHPASANGHSLLACWNPNGESKGCVTRFDPNGKGGFYHARESCVPETAKMNLGGDPYIAYVIAGYNNILAVPRSDGSTNHIIGYMILLWGMATYQHPISYQIAAAGGSRTAYYAGSGYLIRRSPRIYESRTLGGPRRCPTLEQNPIFVAARAYALSPFPQGGVYFGGFDCNFFVSYNSAWVYWGSKEAVYETAVIYDWDRKCTLAVSKILTPWLNLSKE